MSTRRIRIALIVEGDGEADAVPALVRSWIEHRHLHRPFPRSNRPDRFEILRPICAHSKSRLTADFDEIGQLGIEYYVGIALDAEPHLIAVVMDTDDEHSATLRARMEQRIQQVASHIPFGIFLPRPEYEVWFLTGWPHLVNAQLFVPAARALRHEVLEERSGGCKARVGSLLGSDGPYRPTRHQRKLTSALKFSKCMWRSPSFVYFQQTLDGLLLKVLRNIRRIPREVS